MGQSVIRTVAKWVILAILAAIVGALALGPLQPLVNRSTTYVLDQWDGLACGGRAASEAGDRLSEAASNDPEQARTLFQQANEQYAKAYACGYPDAGLRLAVSHCMGLGMPKDQRKARSLVLEVESHHPEKIGRANDVRRTCGF